jgi:MOSC domain-containing protein YiiM
MNGASLLSIQVGRIAPLGPEAVPSGFIKTRIDGPVAVGPLGLAGDEQADLSVHGGIDKAVYGYSAANLAAWQREFPEHAALFVAGGVGENLTIHGLTEADLCVGDVHRVGTAKLQVVQPRQPCFKFALRFGDSRLPKAMVRNGRAGWYYRVVEPGAMGAGDAVERIGRPHPDFSFSRLVEIVNFRNPTHDELEAMAAMEGLADGLRAKAQAALGRAP